MATCPPLEPSVTTSWTRTQHPWRFHAALRPDGVLVEKACVEWASREFGNGALEEWSHLLSPQQLAGDAALLAQLRDGLGQEKFGQLETQVRQLLPAGAVWLGPLVNPPHDTGTHAGAPLGSNASRQRQRRTWTWRLPRTETVVAGALGVLVVAALALPLGNLGLMACSGALEVLQDVVRLRVLDAYVQVPGEVLRVVETGRTSHSTGKNSTPLHRWEGHVDFAYLAHGQTLHGRHEVATPDIVAGEAVLRRELARFEVGAAVPVWMDPEHPERASLDLDARPGWGRGLLALGELALGLLFLSIIPGLLLLGMRGAG